MTVTANTTRNDYLAGTNQNVYNYTFQLNDAADVTVLLGGVVQTLNVHYTVQDLGVGTGGTITFTLVDSNNDPIYPTQGTAIAILMTMELDRDTSYQPNGAFLASDVNNDYDRLWLVANQQQTAINRSIRLQDSDPPAANPTMQLPLKAERLGKYLGFDSATGEPIAVNSHEDDVYVLKVGDTMTGLLNNTVGYAVSGTTFINSSGVLSNVSGAISQFTNDSNYLTSIPTATASVLGGLKLFSDTVQTVASNTVGSTASRTYGVQVNSSGQAVVNVPWVTGGSVTLAQTLVLGNTTSGTDIAVSAGDDITFTGTSKALFGASADLEIYADGNASYITENSSGGSGNLIIRGSNLEMRATNDEMFLDATENGIVRLYCDNQIKLTTTSSGINVTGLVEFDSLSGIGSVEVTDILDEDTLGSDSATALATQQSIKAYVDSQVPSAESLATTLGVGNTTSGNDIAISASDDITFTDSSKALFGASADLQIYHDGTNSYITENAGGSGNLIIRGSTLEVRMSNDEPAISATENGVVQLYCDGNEKLRTIDTGVIVYGSLKGPSSFSITPSDINGTVFINGNLTVQGTTTTIDSTVLEIEDPHITLNKGQTGTPSSSLISGFIVDRGDDQDVDMVWMENSSNSGAWFAMADNGTRYQLLDSANFNTVIPILDGGSF